MIRLGELLVKLGRITSAQLDAAVAELEIVTAEIDQVEVNAQLARRAGELAQAHALRGYHAVHLAAAMAVAGLDFVFVTGDGALAAAAGKAGVAVSVTNR